MVFTSKCIVNFMLDEFVKYGLGMKPFAAFDIEELEMGLPCYFAALNCQPCFNP